MNFFVYLMSVQSVCPLHGFLYLSGLGCPGGRALSCAAPVGDCCS